MAFDANTTVLIVDDSLSMAQGIRAILSMAGVSQADTASSAAEAQNRLRGRRYDAVLCDYNLGRGMSGQELLEAMRKDGNLPPSTLWVMISGERNYSQVAGAAEMIPDDYILKPFTAQQLLDRLEAAARRKAWLAPAYKLLDKGRTEQAIAQLMELAKQAENRQRRLDALRLCGELQAREGLHDAALQLYRAVLAQTDVPWAKMGVARILAEQGDGAGSRELLDQVIAVAPRYTEAYDLLAQNLIDEGGYAQAAAVLEKAVAISPRNFRRLHHYGTSLLRSGEAERAVESLQKAVDIGRGNSFFGPEAMVDLLQARCESGQTQQLDRLQKDIAARQGELPGGPLTMAVCRALAALALQQPAQALPHLQEAAEWLRSPEVDFASAQRFLAVAVRLPDEQGGGHAPPWARLISLRFADGRHELGALQEITRERPACRDAIEQAYEELQEKGRAALEIANQGRLDEAAKLLHDEAMLTLNCRLGHYGCAMLLRIAENRSQTGLPDGGEMRSLRELLGWLPHDNERVRGFVKRRQALLRHPD
ncbi:response regulator [Chromobacterium alticapitis]|uniref:Response regulator n=1 Tax=Chromobacterium alticapitis TaxID=2073169 RepID=A0A2S5DIT3_9NEIS|nr:response regulator [Chromobacterium alticapitis]POZ62990.1 response regulator [Chromobacterium alticapitis]